MLLILYVPAKQLTGHLNKSTNTDYQSLSQCIAAATVKSDEIKSSFIVILT